MALPCQFWQQDWFRFGLVTPNLGFSTQRPTTAVSQNSISDKGPTSHRPLSVTQLSKWKIGFHLLRCLPSANDRTWVSEREERALGRSLRAATV